MHRANCADHRATPCVPARRLNDAGRDCADQRCQGRRIVEQAERRNMVAAAGVIAPALAGADEDAGIGAARGLANLDKTSSWWSVISPDTAIPPRFERRSNDPGGTPSVVANRRNCARAAV
jgi:hypothetical protein